MMHAFSRRQSPAIVTIALAFFLAICPLAMSKAAASTVSGEAYGVSVDVTGLTVAKIPQVLLPSAGGSASATVLGVNASPTVTTGTLTVMTSGTTGPNTANAQSSSTVETVDVLNGLVTATLVTAQSSSTCDGNTASSSAAGSQLVDVVVNGVPIAGTPPANTMIPIPGLGTVTLNEQIPGGDGTDTSELTVNMIHVILTVGPVTGDIVIASAHSDVNCAAAPGPTPTPTATPPLACAPLPTATPTPGAETPIVSGEAFGASATLAGVVVVDEVPHVVLPPEGGSASATVLAVNQPGILTTGTLSVSTSGTTTPGSASSQSSSTVQQVDILNGLVTATAVDADSSSTCNGATASSSGAGSQFTGLVVNGLVLGNITPAPNTMISVPGVGTVILNEQIQSGAGVDTSALTVNMIHIVLAAPLDGDIIVASAHSDVDCDPAAPPPLPPNTSVSGEAYGAFVDVPPATLGRTPDVILPAAGGMEQATVLGINVLGTLTTGTATVMTSGTAGATTASSQSSSTVQQVSILPGLGPLGTPLVTADVLTAMASCTCNGTTASCSDAGTQLVNLVVAGIPIALTPPLNTLVIPVPGVGTVFVNEQTTAGDNIDTAELTVNMIHVDLTGILMGDIIISSAHSDVNCAQGPAPTPAPTSTAPASPTCTPAPTTTGLTPPPTPTATPPANCGNGVVDPGETCDPPGAPQPPNNNPCRADCTFCGDALVQNGETCDDGNSTSGCNPARPQDPLDPCQNNCTPAICSDPASITFRDGFDELKVHGRIAPVAPETAIDASQNPLTLELTSPDVPGDGVVYTTALSVGAITGSARRYRYTNRSARQTGGIASLVLALSRGQYRVNVRAYGDMQLATANMTTHIVSGAQEWTVTGTWVRTSRGWKLTPEGMASSP